MDLITRLKFKQINSINILTQFFIFINLFSTIILANKLNSNNKSPKAFAAPSGPNSVDEIEIDGLIKTFVKVDGFRDGVQKGIFDETRNDNTNIVDFEQKESKNKEEFSVYDDNNLIESNREDPLFIPIPYQKKTTKEEKIEKKLISTNRPVISPNLNNNEVSILVKTTPVLQTTTLKQPQIQFISQKFVQSQNLTRLPITQQQLPQLIQQPLQNLQRNSQLRPSVTSQFHSLQNSIHQQTLQRQPSSQLSLQSQSQNLIHQQTLHRQPSSKLSLQSQSQNSIHQQTLQRQPSSQLSLQSQSQNLIHQQTLQRQPSLQLSLQSQSQNSIHQQTLQRQPSSQLSLQSQSQNSIHQQTLQRQPSPQLLLQPQTKNLIRQQELLLPKQQTHIQSQIHSQSFQKNLISLQQQMVQQPTFNSHLRKPLLQHQLQTPPRNAHPFQLRNNFSNLSPSFQQKSSNLRTGTCAYTIFYNVAAENRQFTYSHYAWVVSVDQCARTCYEFNCAYAFFDPVNHRCQFNPSTSFSVSKNTCPNWPNSTYINNYVVVGKKSLRISCITCQKRQKKNRRPSFLKITNRNNVNQHSFPHSIVANAAVQGVILEQQPSITIGEKYNGLNDEMFKKTKFLPNEEFHYNLAVSRTTTNPLSNFNSNVNLFKTQSLRSLEIPFIQSLSINKR